MTRPFNGAGGEVELTAFGRWLHDQPDLDSKFGFVTTDIDHQWMNWRSGLWMLLEEKCLCRPLSSQQRQLLVYLDMWCRADPKYRGLHVINCENASPEDGKVWIGDRPISKQDLIAFYRFEKDDSWYRERMSLVRSAPRR